MQSREAEIWRIRGPRNKLGREGMREENINHVSFVPLVVLALGAGSEEISGNF